MSWFRESGVEVLGLSPDPVDKHKRFSDKLSLEYSILSDPEHKTIENYGFWKLKKMYGKEYMGVIRSTVMIDPQGRVGHIWEKVKVKGHVEEVLEKTRELSN